jgi:tetrapyrrole methylase family protein/MazG family protein
LLDNARWIFLRTAVHPGLEDLISDYRVSACDDLYESLPDFDAVYHAIAERIVQAAHDAEVVFAVPGHPRFGERSVQCVINLAEMRGIDVTVHSAVSALDVVSTALSVDPFSEELQIIDAETLDSIWRHSPFSGGRPDIDPTRPSLVAQIYSRQIASHVKLTLARIYPEHHKIVVINAAGIEQEESIVDCPLFELDHRPVSHLTSVFVPPLDDLDAHRVANSVQRVVAHLRSPQGCPWDREQSHRSLRSAVIEEAYEVVDAIDDADSHHLTEELGDLFLLVAMLAQIADEAGEFSLEDVYDHISRKLIRRHPHVFAEASATTPDEVIATWEGVKRSERGDVHEAGDESKPHPVDTLPRAMPATTRVARLMARSPATNGTASKDSHNLAVEFYDALERLVAAGLDPDAQLLEIARKRIPFNSTANTGNTSVTEP